MSTTPESHPPTPPPEPANDDNGGNLSSRTRSILNLTSSTLFGIYSPAGYPSDREEPSTPWGTGAETPVSDVKGAFTASDLNGALAGNAKAKARRRSSVHQVRPHKVPKRGFKGKVVPVIGKNASLGVVGVCYGVLISHLHDRQQIAPVKVEGIPRDRWEYLAFWGVVAVALGQLLPWVDRLWNPEEEDVLEDSYRTGSQRPGMHQRSRSYVQEDKERRGLRWTPQWNDVVRSIGIFVGIAFAVVSSDRYLTTWLCSTTNSIDSADYRGNLRSSCP